MQLKKERDFLLYIVNKMESVWPRITEAQPYTTSTVMKKECVDHVQKRLGTQLRNSKKKYKGIGSSQYIVDQQFGEIMIQ